MKKKLNNYQFFNITNPNMDFKFLKKIQIPKMEFHIFLIFFLNDPSADLRFKKI